MTSSSCSQSWAHTSSCWISQAMAPRTRVAEITASGPSPTPSATFSTTSASSAWCSSGTRWAAASVCSSPYQYPQRCEGLVLVSSGGLGPEASLLLRAATLPGAELVIPAISHPRAVSAISTVSRLAGRIGGDRLAMSDETLRTLRELQDAETRIAFLATLRSVVDASGQRVSALPKLAAAEHLPTLLIWGDRDPIIPVQHARDAAERIPRSRLVIFRGAGHEPHIYDPERFAELLHAHVLSVADYSKSA